MFALVIYCRKALAKLPWTSEVSGSREETQRVCLGYAKLTACSAPAQIIRKYFSVHCCDFHVGIPLRNTPAPL